MITSDYQKISSAGITLGEVEEDMDNKERLKHEAIIEDYNKNHKQKLNNELKMFKNFTLPDAIHYAAHAKDPDCHYFAHQWRILKTARAECKEYLEKDQEKLTKAETFDDLFINITDIIGKIHGVGPLMIYDTTLRIGAFLEIEPDLIYLQAGALDGARNLGIKPLNRSVSKNVFKGPLSTQEAKYIEAILCIYKDCLKPDQSLSDCKKGNCNGKSVRGSVC